MQNAIALMISSSGSAVIGVVFWIVAARLAPTATVGRTSAEIAAMLLLATLAQLSFGSIFERFLPVAGELTLNFVKRAYLISCGLGLILATAYLALGFGRTFLPSALPWKLLFVASVVMWTVFSLQDSVLIGLRAAKWVAIENIAYGIVKLALLPVGVTIAAKEGIFLAWTAPVILTIVAISWYLFNHRIPQHQAANSSTEKMPSTGELLALASAQYASLLTTVFLPSVVSLIVIQHLGPIANAYYYLPAMISSSLGLFAWGIARSFLVEASTDPGQLRSHANSAIRGMVVAMVPSVLLGYIFAPLYLQLFGSSYADHGTTLMRMLLLSNLGGAVMTFYSTFAWLDKQVWRMTIRNVAGLFVYLIVIFTLINHHGIDSIGIAALVNSALTLLIFLPMSIRRYRQT